MQKISLLSRRAVLASGCYGLTGFGVGIAPAAEPAKADRIVISDVRTYALRHKLQRAIGVSIALSDIRQALLVKITTDSGHVGWGETFDAGGTRTLIENKLKPALVGQNPLDARLLRRALWGANFGDGRAVGAVDIALDD